LHHAEHHPDLTLGVVTFSEAQAGAIEVALESRRLSRPDLDEFFDGDRLSGFFVKSLENVQGDERDIIIFSIGYGPDETGKFTQNFGPLNRAGGWRRLNVAVSRARMRVEIVSSIGASDFGQFDSIRSDGVRHLQRYLDFAQRGIEALGAEVSSTGLDAESPFEKEVIRVIRGWGYKAESQVGCAGFRIDVGVRHPTRSGAFVLGVECDGLMYHSSRVARDRDRLRQEVLERLGWRIHRIWGTAWDHDRAAEERRLRAAIHSASSGSTQQEFSPASCLAKRRGARRRRAQ
jgi:very-short-patch-repair endonuclease